MSLKGCRVCGWAVAQEARSCPQCGARRPWLSQKEVWERERFRGSMIGLGIVLAIAVGFAVWFCLDQAATARKAREAEAQMILLREVAAEAERARVERARGY